MPAFRPERRHAAGLPSILRPTTDFADNTDEEGMAAQDVFTRRMAAKEVSDPDEARSATLKLELPRA